MAIDHLIDYCKAHNIEVMAAAMGGESIWKVNLTSPLLFVLGNEGAGLSQRTMQKADRIVSVPMASDVESLNAAMTGTLLMYECLRQRSNQRTKSAK
jgi:tRNA G18 (ribose-2'-O)-methylase SpoU